MKIVFKLLRIRKLERKKICVFLVFCLCFGGFVGVLSPLSLCLNREFRGLIGGRSYNLFVNTGIYYTIKKILNNTHTTTHTHKQTNREREERENNDRPTDQQRETTEQPPPPDTDPDHRPTTRKTRKNPPEKI